MPQFSFSNQQDTDQTVVFLRALALAHSQGALWVPAKGGTIIPQVAKRCHFRGLVTARENVETGDTEYRLVDGVVYVDRATAEKRCDLGCGNESVGDFKTSSGPWGYLCIVHLFKLGVGLGTGYGQIFVKIGE